MALNRNSRSIISRFKIYFSQIDFPLFATVVAISLFSVFNMYGINGFGSYFQRQIIFIIIGLVMMVVFSFLNYRYLKNYSFPVLFFYFLSLVLLVLTFYSHSVRGVKAWIVLGNFTFEPAELVKLILIILMAKYFSQRHIHINQIKHIIISGIYFLIPATMIVLQPDLGSMIILSLIWLGILLAAGINKKHLFLIIILAILTSFMSWFFILKPYQKQRITSFINPYGDPYGSGYNLIQSKISIGSGYILGHGIGKGSQTNLGYLPEPYNDFIFAAIAEQFGLLGVTLILGAILFIIFRILEIGSRASSNFGRLFVIGFAIFIFAHAFIGSAVNVGLMPVTGIPFPFLSYGGSHLLSLMIGLGISQSIKRYG